MKEPYVFMMFKYSIYFTTKEAKLEFKKGTRKLIDELGERAKPRLTFYQDNRAGHEFLKFEFYGPESFLKDLEQKMHNLYREIYEKERKNEDSK